tara:strand:+ start:429 stop:1052 length:624 start_codon:yes stop_codon:yes gene_type:complete
MFEPVDFRSDKQRIRESELGVNSVKKELEEIKKRQEEIEKRIELLNMVTEVEIDTNTGVVNRAETFSEKFARRNFLNISRTNTVIDKTVIVPYTWAVTGTISLSSYAASVVVRNTYTGNTASPITAKIVSASYQIASGTNVTWKLQKNGADLDGYGTSASPLTATTTAALTESVQTLADQDILTPVPVGVSGSPTNFNLTVHLEYTI